VRTNSLTSFERKAVEAILLKLNAEKPMHHLGTVTFGGLCDRYIAEELPERYSNSGVVSVEHQPAHQAALEGTPYRGDQADGR
jgi:hypothetical protein